MYHMFDIEVAERYGVNAAIIFNNLGFWIEHNRANGTNYHDGRYWTYNSIRAFSELFPYLSARQISSALSKLEEDGLIVTGNFNTSAYDRTKWYAFTDYGDSIYKKCEMETSKKSNQNGGNVEPIPDINTDVITDSKPDGKTKEVKHKYGEYKNVLLSDSDMAKLKAEFPNDWSERIERLSSYMASTGKSYKNHLATIRNWARRDGKQPIGKDKPKSQYDYEPDYTNTDSSGNDYLDKIFGVGKYANN